MAAITATKNGNWSDPTVWSSNPALPGSGDTADSNGYTVTIDQNVDLSPGGALIGTNASAGGFTCSIACTITANITATVRDVLQLNNGAGVTVAIVGDLVGGSQANINAVVTTGSGPITITGAVTGGTANGAYALYLSTSSPVTISGVVTGGSVATCYGIYNASGGSVSITGSVIGGSAHSSNSGVHNGSTGKISLTGDSTGNAGPGISNITTGEVTITGNATGGNSAAAYGVNNVGTGTVTISGSATGGSHATAYGVNNASTGIANAGMAVGGSVVGAVGLYGANASGVVTFKVAKFSAQGIPPVGGYAKMEYDQDVNYIRVIRSDTGAAVDLSNDYPAITDVKKDVIYKLTGLTGTYDPTAAAVYPAESDVLDTDVAYGPTGAEYAGTYHEAEVAEVKAGVAFGPASTYAGTYDPTVDDVWPATGDVEDGVSYGPTGADYTGTVTLPAVADVEAGVQYGAGGVEFTGTLIGGTDWTDDEKRQIRQALGVTGLTAATTGTGVLDSILADTETDGDILETLLDQIDAVKAKTDTIASGNITVISPVTAAGDVEIDRGYDYYAVDDRSLTWTDETPTTWPNLTDATATFIVGDYVSKECTITNPTGPATITLELSAAETELLPVGARPFRIECALSNAHVILQIRGVITVRD